MVWLAWISRFRLMVCVLLAALIGEGVLAVEPANPRASAATSHVLRYLTALSGAETGRLILGQNLGHGSVASLRGLDRYVNRLAQISGQRPGLLGIDLGYNHVSRRF